MRRLVFIAADLVAVSLLVFGPHLRRHRRRDSIAAYFGVDRSPTAPPSLAPDRSNRVEPMIAGCARRCGPWDSGRLRPPVRVSKYGTGLAILRRGSTCSPVAAHPAPALTDPPTGASCDTPYGAQSYLPGSPPC